MTVTYKTIRAAEGVVVWLGSCQTVIPPVKFRGYATWHREALGARAA